MKISIITPTHDPKFLRELEETILAQTYGDWEWIVLLNQGAKFEAQGSEHRAQPKIKIIECPFTSRSVGFLKRLACMNAEGDIIAEVDHDDLLTPDCLEKVVKAFEDTEVGFVFSENAKLSDKFRPYDAEYGWTHKRFTWKGKKIFAMNNQPVYPGRLGHIWYAPDHIRAWRRDVYESIGGHDDSLKVCDDLDLMHRLYLVTKFREIPEVLYVYRINGENTFMQSQKMIKELDDILYDKNIEALAKRFAEINKLEVIDFQYTPSTPLGERPDNSVGVIIAKDCMQYVKDQKAFMFEVHRVLAPGGMLISETPSTDGRGAFMDPDAVSFWNENSFWYYTKPNWAKRIGNRRMFRPCRLATVYKDEFGKEHKLAYVRAHLEKLA